MLEVASLTGMKSESSETAAVAARGAMLVSSDMRYPGGNLALVIVKDCHHNAK